MKTSPNTPPTHAWGEHSFALGLQTAGITCMGHRGLAGKEVALMGSPASAGIPWQHEKTLTPRGH